MHDQGVGGYGVGRQGSAEQVFGEAGALLPADHPAHEMAAEQDEDQLQG